MADPRNRDLAKIHIGVKALGMDRPTYEAMLQAVTGDTSVTSAADLTATGRARVLERLRQLGWQPRRKGAPRPRPGADKAPLVSKVRALLADAGRPDSYADAMARRMFRIERYEWLPTDDLRRLVAALAYDAKRRAQRAPS